MVGSCMLASSPASMVNHIEPRRRKRYRIGAFRSCSSARRALFSLALKARFARAFAHLETEMANYFTQFSCLLPVGSAANLDAALAIYHAYAVERAEAEEPLGLVADAYPSYNKPDDNKVWLHADDGGEPDDVQEYVFRCAATLGLSGISLNPV